MSTLTFIERNKPWLVCGLIIYSISLPVLHLAFAHEHVWHVAVFFSVALNATYPVQAITKGTAVGKEIAVAGVLISMSLVALVASPLWVIGAVLGHGVWDWMKCNGHGVSFFRWYTIPCLVIDGCYASVLLIYYLSG